MASTVIHPDSITAMRPGAGGDGGGGGGRKHARSPDSEALENTPRLPPSDAEDEDSETMISGTPLQLSHRDHEDMLVYADQEYEDEDAEEEDEEEEEEDAIELVVETLTGDSYRVRVSQWDTAASLKDLLYRTQGIHPGYQHLIYQERELMDDACLIDQQVMDGSTLRLVLAIRGGPVNARRLPTHEDLLLRDLTDHLDSNSQRQGVGQTLTFLVFHDDENMNVNVYRVVENQDGSYSPLNESWGSVGSGRGGAEEVSSLKTHLTEEEKRTMARMADLRTEMDKLRLRNKKKKKERMKAGGMSSTQTSLNSSLRSVAGRLEEAITPRLDLTDISGVSTATTTTGGTLTTPRKRSPVKRLAGIRRGSRPTTQERMELMKSSHGRATLRELPTANPPVPVDFTRRKPLEAIRPQLVRGRLEAVDEMLGRGESTPEHVARRSPLQHEAWPTREAPRPPLYMLPQATSRKHRRYDQDRLNHSHNQELLRPMRHTAGRRPKTSPEVLERRPGGLPDGATGERVLLRGTDERLRELCSILEPVRGDSSHSQRLNSPVEAALPPLNLSTSFAGHTHNPPPPPPPRMYRSNSVSVSLASLRTRGATPPSPGQGALVTSGSREQRDALRGLISGSSRPGSARIPPPHAPLPPPQVPAPAVLPPVTPKRRKGRRKPRCEKCSRRLGVSSTYECRCGGIFCAQHRYSETHTCSFDYRTAGRAMLAMANPLVAPNRVPKI